MNPSTTGTSRTVQQNEVKASFEINTGGRKKTLLIHKNRVVIGAVESADLKIDGNGVAPIHAVVEIQWASDPSKCEAKILDLASATGVWINGSKVVHETLKSGDTVKIGESSFQFSFKKPDPKSMLPDQSLLLIDAGKVTPIFDYRPAVKDTLETVYSWNQSILDVQHHSNERPVEIPAVYLKGLSKPLAQKSGNRWLLTLDEQMSGVIYQNGELKSIQQLKKQNSPLVIGENDFAKIETGTMNIYLSETIAPPVLVRKMTLVGDPLLAKSMMISLALSVLMIFGVSQIPEVEKPQIVENKTIATILYSPEKYGNLKPPVPKTEPQKAEPEKPKMAEVDFSKPKEDQNKTAQSKSSQPGKKQAAQSQSKEGEGARAKGAEGSRGSKNATVSNVKQSEAYRPSTDTGKNRGGTESQAVDNGNVQMLKGETSKILDLLGGSGKKLGKSGSKLTGFGGFSTQGNGGLALSGGGKGGGGNADTLLGGLGEKGRGGGKVGTGLGAVGTGAGIVGGETRVELNLGGGDEEVVVGAIDRDAIDAAIRKHRDEIRYCYERQINSGAPNIAGKIIPEFVIGASGKASQLHVVSSSIGNAIVENCVLGVLGRIQFPLPAGGVPVKVKYPFNFANASK